MKKSAFSSIELLLTILMSVITINGVVISVINSMVLNEINQNYSVAINVARARMEQTIGQKSNFDSIVSSEGALTLNSDGITGRYRIDVTGPGGGAPTSIKNIKVAVCWLNRGARVVGDCDKNPDGTLSWKNIGDPTSPCVLQTSIAKR